MILALITWNNSRFCHIKFKSSLKWSGEEYLPVDKFTIIIGTSMWCFIISLNFQLNLIDLKPVIKMEDLHFPLHSEQLPYKSLNFVHYEKEYAILESIQSFHYQNVITFSWVKIWLKFLWFVIKVYNSCLKDFPCSDKHNFKRSGVFEIRELSFFWGIKNHSFCKHSYNYFNVLIEYFRILVSIQLRSGLLAGQFSIILMFCIGKKLNAFLALWAGALNDLKIRFFSSIEI